MTARIGIIVSTIRPARVGPVVADWIASGAPNDVSVEVIDLAKVNLPFFVDEAMPSQANYDQPSTKAWSELVEGFDGFVIALAEYNAGYPAPLKNAIDTLYKEWSGKPIAVVSYGPRGGGRSRAALEPVLRTIRAKQVDGPSLTFKEHLGFDGELLDMPDEELAAMYTTLLEQLSDKD